jgi:hypothetical protein
MAEHSLGLYAAIVCAVFYWGTVVLLIAKNPNRAEPPIVAAMALVVWPCLLLGSVAQLLFLVPIYTVFFMHGLKLPSHLPFKTVRMAILLTLLAFGLLVVLATWTEPSPN